MDDVTRAVSKQYSDYAYPKPFDDLAAATAAGNFDFGDPTLFGPMLWPERPPRATVDILVAGCGTQQAAILAYANPRSRVVGIDLSEASLGHQRYLREKHGLENLELFQGDLREAGNLGRQFDLIVSTGVLHHMADPGEGLRALKGVLRPDGAMLLMVYGAVARTGVYMIQDVCRRLGLGQHGQGVAAVRQILAALPANHAVKDYIARTPELAHDEAVVDTFLHPQDRAYTVPQLLAWLEDNGMAFQAWSQNLLYYPEALVPEPVRGWIQQLPISDQWAAVENIQGRLGMHLFIARQEGKAVAIDFSGPRFLGYRPSFQPATWVEGERTLRLREYSYSLTDAELAAVRGVDGAATISAIMDGAAFADFPREDREAFGRKTFEWLWKIGAVMFRLS